MKKYKKSSKETIEAIQYDGSDHDLIQHIVIDYVGNITPIKKENAYGRRGVVQAINTHSGWKKPNLTDWIVKKNNKILLVSDDVFQLLYEEA